MGLTELVSIAVGGFTATVSYIYDGDTFRTEQGDRVRLWGIDAPEMDESGGVRAKDMLHNLAARSNNNLTCYTMGSDDYGRTVARCDTESGDDIACLMIRNGAAEEWWAFSRNRYADCGR